ncbi:MAG TPA: 4'-phosphopantetheinyl transferase superfamily protein [Caldilineaceae bacterium]|nr:4'-phosphopantetheinyl transferase superfamily protein [Caldilineaceae bacterium]
MWLFAGALLFLIAGSFCVWYYSITEAQTVMIRWSVQSVVDHPDLSAGRPPAGLLNPDERHVYAGLLNPQRRRDWLLGRWTAKRLVQAHLAAAAGFFPILAGFTISQDIHGAPVAISHDAALLDVLSLGAGSRPAGGQATRLPLLLSISHSHGYACCAVCDAVAGIAGLGIDLEPVERREARFRTDFFSEQEQHALAALPAEQQDRLISAGWSAKEAALKALGLGLRVDPRQVQCFLTPGEPCTWTPFRIEPCGEWPPARAGRPAGFAGWWRLMDNRLRPGEAFVLTLVAALVASSEAPNDCWHPEHTAFELCIS